MTKTYNEMAIRAERRVAIAKDVISHIQASKLKVEENCGYVRHPKGAGAMSNIATSTSNTKELANKLKEQCCVCALGAMMLCKIEKFNNYKFNLQNSGYISIFDVYTALEDVITETQLCDIERAFEKTDPNSPYNEISNPIDRLLAIMQNIIDHDGIFKPNVTYKIIG